MKIIPFDIEKAKSGKYKIQTRDGKLVRIICWDKKTTQDVSLVGLVDHGDFEVPILIDKNHTNMVLVDENAPNISQRIFDIITKKCNDYPCLKHITPISTVVLSDFIQEELNLPQWKLIKKGEELPKTSILKGKNGTLYCVPYEKGEKVNDDYWYLPIIELEKLDYEI